MGFNWLQQWADRKLKQFSKGKHRTLQLKWNNPMQQYRLGALWLETSFAAKGIGSWWVTS